MPSDTSSHFITYFLCLSTQFTKDFFINVERSLVLDCNDILKININQLGYLGTICSWRQLGCLTKKMGCLSRNYFKIRKLAEIFGHLRVFKLNIGKWRDIRIIIVVNEIKENEERRVTILNLKFNPQHIDTAFFRRAMLNFQFWT